MYQKLSEKQRLYTIDRSPQTIKRWLEAWTSAEHPYMPRFYRLIDVYEMAMLDLHLSGVIDNRKNKVKGEPFLILNAKNEIDTEKTDLLNKGWFNDFISKGLDAIFFGYTLLEIEIKDIDNQKKLTITEIDRRNVVPQRNEFLPNFFDMSGINIEDKEYQNYYILVKSSESILGKINKVVPWTISKRFAGSTHDSLNQRFGKPFITAKTNKSEDDRQLIKQSLLEFSENGIAVIDLDEVIELLYPSGANNAGNNMEQRIERANSEISKYILGHTKSADDGKSQTTYVNKNESDKTPSEERKESDMYFIENLINEELLPRLTKLGYADFTGFTFMFNWTWQQKNKRTFISETLIKTFLDAGYEIPEEWILENFNLPVKKIVAPVVPVPNTNNDTNNDKNNNTNNASNTTFPKDVQNSLNISNTITDEEQEENNEDVENYFLELTTLILNFIKMLWNGKNPTDKQKTTFAKKVQKPFIAAIEKNLIDGIDEAFVKQLKENIFAFSKAKTLVQLEEISKLLLDENGNKKSFVKFKNDVLKIHKTYNKNYLSAEYELAITQSRMASKWFEMVGENQNTLLVYSAVKDQRTTNVCKGLDKVIKPASDSFWKTYYPPNHWRCRSTVRVATDNEKETEIENQEALPKFEGADEIFKGNVALDGVIFPPNHPYFKELENL